MSYRPRVGAFSVLKRTQSDNALAGSQYLLYPELTQKPHEKWRRRHRSWAFAELLGGGLGMMLSGLLAWGVMAVLWSVGGVA